MKHADDCLSSCEFSPGVTGKCTCGAALINIAKIEELYEYVRTNSSDNKPYSICAKICELFPDTFRGYKCQPYQFIPSKG